MFGIDDMILGGLSFGGQLLSGLGAQQSAKKQQKLEAAYEYQNFQLQEAANAQNLSIGQQLVTMYDPATRLVGDAAKAGFNPVTWGAMMGGLYQNMTQYGWALQKPELYFQSAPKTAVPSTLSAIGGAISAGATTLASAHANTQRVDAVNQSAMLQYLSSVQRARAGGNALSGLGTPAFDSTPRQVLSGGGAAAALSIGAGFGGKAPKLNAWGVDVKAPQASTPSFMIGDQSISGADTAQAAYDWPMSIPFGIAKFGADSYRTFTGRQIMGDFYSDLADVRPPTMPTDRGQAAQAERAEQAFGGLPWYARNVPWLKGWGQATPAVQPFWENPHVYQ